MVRGGGWGCARTDGASPLRRVRIAAFLPLLFTMLMHTAAAFCVAVGGRLRARCGAVQVGKYHLRLCDREKICALLGSKAGEVGIRI